MIKLTARKSFCVLLTIAFLQLNSNVYADQEPNVVALFGDSISLGFNSNFSERFGLGQLNFGQPSIQLDALLNESKRSSVVPNLGIGGTSSGPATAFIGSAGAGNGVDRISGDLANLKTDIAGRAYYVLIMYGTNDSARGIPSSVTAFNNGLMIEKANAQGYTVVVSSIMPCDVCANNVYSINNQILSEVNRRVGLGADVHFVDNHGLVRAAWVGSLSEADGVHPNDAAYKLIAENWFNAKLVNLISQDPMSISPIISLLLDD